MTIAMMCSRELLTAECARNTAGNYMNAGNRNLAAFGFRVETLHKLKETRSTQKKCARK